MSFKWFHRLRPPAFTRSDRAPLSAVHSTLPPTPLVSVIMTAFNSAEWIRPAVSSILSQDWRNLELVVVDDGSTDRTPAIVAGMQEGDPRVRLVASTSNEGTYAAKNRGVEHARGEVLAFMDSDDQSHPSRLTRQLEALDQPGRVATTCDYERRDFAGNLVMNRGLPARQCLASLMIKREVVDDIGGFDRVRVAADDEFFERIRHVYGRASHENVPAPLYQALARQGSLSATGPAAVSLQARASGEGLSSPRAAYKAAYQAWYEALSRKGLRPYMDPSLAGRMRPFPTSADLR